jgi:DHA1 family bicyclomycin/chloramphenicol resistance-like MFS transporter
VVRDLASGAEAAKLYATLMLVTGVAPMLAPLVGGQLLHVTDWRGTFVVLAVIGLVLLALAAARMPETLLAGSRHVGGAASRRAFGELLRDRSFLAFALCVGLSFGTLTAYLGGSSFVLEDIHGLSPQLFGVITAINAAGMVAAAQLSGRIVRRVGPDRLLDVGLGVGALVGVLLVVVVLGGGGLVFLLPCLFLTIATRGFITPNAQALALAEHPGSAGTAAGILGVLQFGLGGAAAPLAGVAGPDTALPMALTIAGTSIAAVGVLALRGRSRRRSALAV